MLNEFVPTGYEACRLTDLGQLIVEEIYIAFQIQFLINLIDPFVLLKVL